MRRGWRGLAGVLFAYYRPGLKWDMGAEILLLLFAAVTLGGLGTAFGAAVGAIIIGLVVEVSTLWIPADLRFAAPLVVLIVINRVKITDDGIFKNLFVDTTGDSLCLCVFLGLCSYTCGSLTCGLSSGLFFLSTGRGKFLFTSLLS